MGFNIISLYPLLLRSKGLPLLLKNKTSVGGDGTTLLKANALLNKDIPPGIIPAGSANGMAT